MAYKAGSPLRGQIHSETSIVSGVWQTYRQELTGRFLSGGGITGPEGMDLAYHDMREFNKKIDTLTGTFGHQEGTFIKPFDAGFSYTGSNTLIT
tara:strand:+ start:334 stop:615 length:282 start_codon:yes stop_codon:yes gene_type:complete